MSPIKLEPSCAILEPSWAKWVQVGLAPSEPMLRPCRIETVHLTEIEPIGKMCKFPQSRSLFGGPLLSNMQTPG